MSRFGYDDGWRKVGKKARRGKKNKTTGNYRQHRTSKPLSAYDSGRNSERRKRLNDLRAADLDKEEREW